MQNRLIIRVNEADNVAITLKEVKAYTELEEGLFTSRDIPQAHKVALHQILKGEAVIR